MFKTNFLHSFTSRESNDTFNIWFAFITFYCWYNVVSYNFNSSPLKWLALSIGVLPAHVHALFYIGLVTGAVFALTVFNTYFPKRLFLAIQTVWLLLSLLILLVNNPHLFMSIVTCYAFIAGIIFAKVVYQIIFFMPKNCWIRTIVSTFSIVQSVIYLYRIFPMHNYPKILYWFGIILQVVCLYCSIRFKGNVLSVIQNIPVVKLNNKLLFSLFGVFILLTTCMTIVKNVVLPSFATNHWLNYYQIFPDILTWVALYLWGPKLKRVLFFQTCVFLISLTFVSFQLLKGSIAGHLIARTLMEPAYLCWDVFFFSLVIDLVFKYWNQYTRARTTFLAMFATIGLTEAGTSALLGRSLGIQSHIYVLFYLVCFIMFFMFPYIEHVLEQEGLNGWNKSGTTALYSFGLPVFDSPPTTLPMDTSNLTYDLPPSSHPDITSYLEEGVTLTPREKEVLAQMMDKQDNDVIANRLGISKNTVKIHVKNILSKFNVKNRQELYSLYDPNDKVKALTRRETEVLQLLLASKSKDEIAQELYISTNTVKIHIWNICRKYEVSDQNTLLQKLLPPV